MLKLLTKLFKTSLKRVRDRFPRSALTLARNKILLQSRLNATKFIFMRHFFEGNYLAARFGSILVILSQLIEYKVEVQEVSSAFTSSSLSFIDTHLAEERTYEQYCRIYMVDQQCLTPLLCHWCLTVILNLIEVLFGQRDMCGMSKKLKTLTFSPKFKVKQKSH